MAEYKKVLKTQECHLIIKIKKTVQNDSIMELQLRKEKKECKLVDNLFKNLNLTNES